MQWESREPVFGDIVRVKVTFYYHYGVFVSEDRVIQFGLPDNITQKAEEVRVCVSDIATFLNGGDIEVGVGGKRRSAEAAVAMAESRIGEGGYDVLHNNCEHFASDCVLGERRSFLDDVRKRLRDKLGK